MLPQKQTIFSDEKQGTVGNCLQACVASLLDLQISEVPHFSWYMGEWYHRLYQFLKTKDCEGYGTWSVKSHPDWKGFKGIDGFVIAGGTSPRGIFNGHAVIYKDGEPFFDPHPD